MTLREIERIQSALKANLATTKDFCSATDEAMRFHHKVTELQEMLLIIKKKCESEICELEAGKTPSSIHFALVMDYILDVIQDSQHIKAA